ncbi:MAG: hypothetical protein CME65_06570 [Halobacteriovoraceae bacterium]|nr:hypothetical protein [Halobacteriovoraceae bacterium]|tara:strand:- start:17710 stop:18267 length:558 start_codon:yes stop_codon:yes gene_type:complete
MRKGILIILAMITMIYYADKANAAFLLEPYAGAQFNSTFDVDGGSEGDITGSAVGMKFGFTQMGFSFGLNGQRATSNFETESGSESDYTFTRMGAFVGYDTPMGVRLWGEYVFSFQGINDDDSDQEYTEGGGTAFGFGYKVLPFISLNLEIANLSTAKYVNGATDLDLDIAYSSYLLSISLPFSI